MEISSLIRELSRPDAYPHPAEDFRVHHTHISVVFLAGAFAYKVKKSRDLGFLDFTDRERRHHFCREEVRLNRRLAPSVYLGVVPVVRDGGTLRFGEREDKGEVVEWAVKMRRLPPAATLRERLLENRLQASTLEALARRVAAFHQEAESGPEISRYGRFSVVARNARDNLEQTRDHVGTTFSSRVHDRLSRKLEDRLNEHRTLIEQRASRGVPRDTHGDLHLDHVYLFPDRDPPDDLVIIDCIEFSPAFRCSDPVSDMAFLAMDLIHHGRRDLEARFSRSYFHAAGDEEGRALLPFYRSYRAAVRGKVEGIAALEEEVPEEEREAALRNARGHWLLALSELEGPGERPGLVLVGGLPGTGKSTVAQGVAREAGFQVVSSDRTRKALAGAAPTESRRAGFQEGIYGPQWTERTYQALLGKVREGLFQGDRIVVDATFRDEEDRRAFLETARASGVRALFLECRAPSEVVRERLEARTSDPSDADWHIHREVARRWEGPGEDTKRDHRVVETGGSRDEALAGALGHLAEGGLMEDRR
jgi:uncharacterized protein